MKVSFIIPVYNAEQYLSRCLDSVVEQSVRDIEVICVNDCSSDNSQAILAAYAARDSRFRLIHFERNKGPGAARNAGLDAVSGEFIRMVDSDDAIPLDSTEKLFKAAEQHGSNFVRGGFQICSASGEILGKGWNYPTELVVNTSIKTEKRLWGFDQHWAFLYRTQALLASGARYDESMRNGQDAAFLVDLMPFMEQVTLIPETVYYYRENPASIMRRKRSKLFYLNVFSLYARAYECLVAIDAREAADYILYQALCYYLPDKILSSIPNSLNRQDAMEVFRNFNALLREQQTKKLCLERPYAWQNNRLMPWRAKYLFLLLFYGHLEEAYSDLKHMEDGRKKEQELLKKINICQHQLEKVYSSTSWKVTAPLRMLGKMISRRADR